MFPHSLAFSTVPLFTLLMNYGSKIGTAIFPLRCPFIIAALFFLFAAFVHFLHVWSLSQYDCFEHIEGLLQFNLHHD